MITTGNIQWAVVDVVPRERAQLHSQVVIKTQINEYGKEIPKYLTVSTDLMRDLKKEIGPVFGEYKNRWQLLRAGTLMALKPSTVGNLHFCRERICYNSSACHEIHKTTHAWVHDAWVQDGMIIFKPAKETE